MVEVPIVGVCGPIASGKSGLVISLADALRMRAHPERVGANVFFESYLADPARYAFWSELAFILGAVEDASILRGPDRSTTLRDRKAPAQERTAPATRPGGLLERPAQEMLGVFVAFLRDEGHLDGEQVRVLEAVVAASENLVGVPDVFVVLHAPPDELMRRLACRRDPGDDKYDLADMTRLACAYERWRVTLDAEHVINVDVQAHDLRRADEVIELARNVEAALRRL